MTDVCRLLLLLLLVLLWLLLLLRLGQRLWQRLWLGMVQTSKVHAERLGKGPERPCGPRGRHCTS